MCVENAMELTLESDTFATMKRDFDDMLMSTLKNMQTKGAENADLTLKLHISIENTNVTIRGENTDIVRPSFKHDLGSIMQIKDKKTGSLSGEMQLVWDEETGKPFMRKIDNGQISLFNDDGDAINADYVEAPALELPLAENTETDERTPFGWLKQFIGQEMKITESMGNYAVRTLDNKIVLTSSTDPDNVFYCDADKLKNHIDHSIVCVGYDDDGETVNISIECEDCNEVLYDLDKYEEKEEPDNDEAENEDAENETDAVPFTEDEDDIAPYGEDLEYDEFADL